MPYLLDTNIISHIARYPEGNAASNAAGIGFENLSTSIIVACEISFGLNKNPGLRSAKQMLTLLSNLAIIPFEQPADEAYGRLRAQLFSTGQIIGANDLLIAAHALSLDYILVTDNIREFSRVNDLKIENWLRP